MVKESMRVDTYISIQVLEILKETIIFDEKSRTWCQLPYPNHPNGCPNYGKNPLCPPSIKYGFKANFPQKEFVYFYLFVATLDLFHYKQFRKTQHPEWSDRMCGNPRYWQSVMKSILKEQIHKKASELYGNINEEILRKNFGVLGCGSGLKIWDIVFPAMEAIGIHVFATLQRNGIKYERLPVNIVRQVALLCVPEEHNWHSYEQNLLTWMVH